MTESLGNPSDDITSASARIGEIVELLDDADVAVALLDGSGSVLHLNAAFARACGRPISELVTNPLIELIIDDDVGAVEEALEQATGGEGPERPSQSTKARVVGADGRVRPLRMHLGHLPGHETPLVLCVAHDRSVDRRRERSDRRARVEDATAEATDAESGLPNRKGLEATLASAGRRSQTRNTPHALIRCELFNDDAPTEPAADNEAIRGCIERVRQRLRPADTVARIDDSVLAVVAEDLHDEQDAAGVAYRLLSTVVEPVPGADGPAGLRMVIGLAMADADTPPNALMAASVEAAADARGPGGFVLMDLRGLQD